MISLAYAALWLFIFAVPWESTVLIPGLGTVSKLLGIVAIVCALFVALVSGHIRRWHVFHVTALLFVIWAACVLLVVHVPEFPPKYWTYVQLFLVLWMIWEIAPSRQRLIGLLTAYVFGAHVAALETIRLYRNKAELLRRFSAGGADANDVAMVLALALPMAWYLGMTYRQPLLRWVCRAYLPIGLVALGLTGSRGGMLATMVALLIVPLTMIKLSPGRRAVAIVLLGLSGSLAMVYVPQTLLQRLATTSTELAEGNLHGRVAIWQAGVKAFSQKPMMGYGTAGFKVAVRPWVGRRVAHNSFLSVLVEQGIVGLLLYAMMLGAVGLAVLKLPLLERRFALVVLATLGVAMLPLTWEDRKAVWVILAILLGLAQAYVAGARAAMLQPQPRRAAPFARPPRARRLAPVTAPDRNADPDAMG